MDTIQDNGEHILIGCVIQARVRVLATYAVRRQEASPFEGGEYVTPILILVTISYTESERFS